MWWTWFNLNKFSNDLVLVCAYPLSPGYPSQLWNIYRVNSQSSDQELPPMTLPKSPPLANTCHNNGPIIFFWVLAFTLPLDFELKWAEENPIGVGKTRYYRCKLVLPAILKRISPDCCRIAVIPLRNGADCFSIVVATNKMVEDLERVKDMEMIQSVQQILGITEPLAWYCPQPT